MEVKAVKKMKKILLVLIYSILFLGYCYALAVGFIYPLDFGITRTDEWIALINVIIFAVSISGLIVGFLIYVIHSIDYEEFLKEENKRLTRQLRTYEKKLEEMEYKQRNAIKKKMEVLSIEMIVFLRNKCLYVIK